MQGSTLFGIVETHDWLMTCDSCSERNWNLMCRNTRMGTYAKAFTYSVVIVNDIQQRNALWKYSNYWLHHLIIER